MPAALPQSHPIDGEAEHGEAGDIAVSLESLDDLAAVERAWLTLQRSCRHSYFQSWGWINAMLTVLPVGSRPELLVAKRDGAVVGLAVMIERSERRRGLIASRSLHLHQCQDVGICYNGFLADEAAEDAVCEAFLHYLGTGVRRGPWDEAYLSAVPPRYEHLAKAAGVRTLVRRHDISRYVDLQRIRETGGDYLSALGKNTRYRIRRSVRLYEERGPLTLAVARSLSEAKDYLDGLIALHQQTWTERGEPGAFGSPVYAGLMQALIDTRFDAGEIQVARLSAGDEVIGYRLNFVYRGHVYMYQSGIRYETDGKFLPGLVTDRFVIEHNLAAGALTYDFLDVDSRFKQSMSTDSAELVYLLIQRKRLDFQVENALRRIKKRLRRGRAT